MATLGFGLHDCIRPCLRRSRHEHRFYGTTPSIAVFWITDVGVTQLTVGDLVLDYQSRSDCRGSAGDEG
jgi:hypothetical protein